MPVERSPLPPSPIDPALLDDAKTLTGMLQRLAEGYPDTPAVVFFDRRGQERRVSFGELWLRSNQLAAVFAERGVRPGDPALLIFPNTPELIAAYFAVILAGGVPGILASPLNRFADRDVYTKHLASIFALAQARILYCTGDVAEILRDGVGLGETHLLCVDEVDGPDDAPPPTLTNIREASGDQLATVQYSSGSTGTPKGALLTHRAMLNNIRATREALALSPDDVSVNWIPLYHDMGLIDAFLAPLLSGSPVVLIPTTDFVRDPSLWLWTIHRYRGTVSWNPNFAYALCAKRISDRELEGLDLSSWRLAMNASESVLANTLDAFAERFSPYGFRREAMTPGWGLAETVCIATVHPPGEEPIRENIDRVALAQEDRARRSGPEGVSTVAIGRCLPRNEIEIRDEAKQVLGDRCVGRVWLRSDSLFAGYQRHPDLTATTLVDEWLDTGDRGYLADGNLYFISREKDLIVIGGEKYSPQDVEAAINRVLGVREGCAVAFGVTNEERGTEDVAAVVETKLAASSNGGAQQDAALDALRHSIRQEVTRSTGLGLRWVILVPPGGIHKTTSGKLARSATQHSYADRLD